MTPLDRAIAIINNTARIENIAGDQLGVAEPEPLYVVTNPAEVARAVLEAIREPSEAMVEAIPDDRNTPIYAEDIWQAMIDAALAESSP